jgi:hypothetical protein
LVKVENGHRTYYANYKYIVHVAPSMGKIHVLLPELDQIIKACIWDVSFRKRG